MRKKKIQNSELKKCVLKTNELVAKTNKAEHN